MIFLNKKRILTVLLFTFIAVVFASILISSDQAVSDEASYYVEDNGNIFIKLAFICDDCAYYIVDLVLGGIESIFSIIMGN